MRDPQRPRVDRLEADVADQGCGDIIGRLLLAAIDEARPPAAGPRFEHPEEDLAGHGIEGSDEPGAGQLPGKLLGA